MRSLVFDFAWLISTFHLASIPFIYANNTFFLIAQVTIPCRKNGCQRTGTMAYRFISKRFERWKTRIRKKPDARTRIVLAHRLRNEPLCLQSVNKDNRKSRRVHAKYVISTDFCALPKGFFTKETPFFSQLIPCFLFISTSARSALFFSMFILPFYPRFSKDSYDAHTWISALLWRPASALYFPLSEGRYCSFPY